MLEIRIRNGNEISENTFRRGIEQIHDSVDWSHYNGCIHQGNTFVACVDDKIAGYVSTMFSRDNAYIPFIAVNKDFQDRRIGQALMSKVVEKCKELGLTILQLDFRGTNEKTKAFYEKFAERNQLTYTATQMGFYNATDPRMHVIMSINKK